MTDIKTTSPAGPEAETEPTAKPFALNLWVPTGSEIDALPTEDFERYTATLKPYFDELGLPYEAGRGPAGRSSAPTSSSDAPSTTSTRRWRSCGRRTIRALKPSSS